MNEIQSIWEYIPDVDRYLSLTYLHHEDFKAMNTLLSGEKPIKNNWKPFPVYTQKEGGTLWGEFPGLPGITPPVFTEKALQVLKHLISDAVETLPLVWIDNKPVNIFAIHVLEIADCLDHSRSEFHRYGDGRIMSISHHEFNPACIQGKHIFKLPQDASKVYVSGVFKHLVEVNELKGLQFRSLA